MWKVDYERGKTAKEMLLVKELKELLPAVSGDKTRYLGSFLECKEMFTLNWKKKHSLNLFLCGFIALSNYTTCKKQTFATGIPAAPNNLIGWASIACQSIFQGNSVNGRLHGRMVAGAN